MYMQQGPTQEQLPLHTRIGERIIWLLRKGGFEFAEFYGGLITFAWGAWVLFPWWLVYPADTFNSSHAFQSFLRLAPEWLWGLAALITGGLHLYLFFVEHRNGRMALCIVNAFLWLFLAFTFWLANHVTTAVPVYGLQAAPFAWSWWRLLIFKDDYN